MKRTIRKDMLVKKIIIMQVEQGFVQENCTINQLKKLNQQMKHTLLEN